MDFGHPATLGSLANALTRGADQVDDKHGEMHGAATSMVAGANSYAHRAAATFSEKWREISAALNETVHEARALASGLNSAAGILAEAQNAWNAAHATAQRAGFDVHVTGGRAIVQARPDAPPEAAGQVAHLQGQLDNAAVAASSARSSLLRTVGAINLTSPDALGGKPAPAPHAATGDGHLDEQIATAASRLVGAMNVLCGAEGSQR